MTVQTHIVVYVAAAVFGLALSFPVYWLNEKIKCLCR